MRADRLLSLAARTATGNSGGMAVEQDAAKLSILLRTTAVSGTTPTNDVTVEWSHDATNFVPADPVDSFVQITTTVLGTKVKEFAVKAPYFRLVYTIAGTTPSFTFEAFATTIRGAR